MEGAVGAAAQQIDLILGAVCTSPRAIHDRRHLWNQIAERLTNMLAQIDSQQLGCRPVREIDPAILVEADHARCHAAENQLGEAAPVVHLSIGGVGRYHLFVKIRKTHEGQPKNVICAAFGAHYDIKQVVVVDDDVEVHDPLQVEWAVATRFRPTGTWS